MDDFKYCLPGSFKLDEIDNAQLSFVDRGYDYPAVFATYMGNDAIDEFLADPIIPDNMPVKSDTYVNELRLIRYKPAEEFHNILITLIVFPDDSFVQIHGTDSVRVEIAINVLMEPVRIK